MKQNLWLWQFGGFSFASLFGTLLHFLYEWTNNNKLAALFSGVNESTWEHMKLLFFPLFIFAIIQSRYFKEYKNFWWIKLIGTLLGLVLIPVLFYTYNGVFGKSPDWLNITIFFICAAAVFLTEGFLFKNAKGNFKLNDTIAFLILCFIGVLFFIFTFFTPTLPIFIDPVTKTYGI